MTDIDFRMILDSHPQNVAEVEPFVTQLVKEYEINDALYGNILITLTEAVSNAIVHGNRAKPQKKVHVSTRCSAQSICFIVEDEGPGFNPESLPDPTSPENILSPGGRGVFLMRQLADELRFLDDGRRVELEFKLG